MLPCGDLTNNNCTIPAINKPYPLTTIVIFYRNNVP
jgi:hypothetical protein